MDLGRRASGPAPVIRALLLGLLLFIPSAGTAQQLLFALPGGASSDNISTPNAFAAPDGVRYIGVSAHTEPHAGDALDGIAVLGVGSGRVSSAVEFSLITSDVSSMSGQFATIKWHFHDETARWPALAVGIEDPTASASRSATPYLSATKTFWDTSAHSAFLMRKAVTLGFGGGRFEKRPFGAVSLSLDSFSKAIVECDGTGVNAGLSLAQSVSPRAVAVVVIACQDVVRPSERAATMSLAVTWQER
jgi:hypothetical protein